MASKALLNNPEEPTPQFLSTKQKIVMEDESLNENQKSTISYDEVREAQTQS